MEGTEVIPGPPGLPLVGNVVDLDPENPVESFIRLADQYGMKTWQPLVAGIPG